MKKGFLWSLRLGVFALKMFCLMAGRKDRGKRPTANAGPGRGRIGQPDALAGNRREH
jgi:hypothetical protein